MKVAFFVTDLQKEQHQYSTYRLAHCLQQGGHQVFHTAASDMTYRKDGVFVVETWRVPDGPCKSPRAYFEKLRNEAIREETEVGDLDILMLRSDPSLSQEETSWAATMGIELGRLARELGVVVLNNPDGLNRALNKMYLQLFPEQVRPRSIVTMSLDDIEEFSAGLPGDLILKPVQGSAGKGVFLVNRGNRENLAQIVQILSRDGYIVAQEYLPEAQEGDTRLFLVNGMPLIRNGKYAAFRRLRKGEDVRSNVHVGGKIARAEITPAILEVVEVVRPRLVSDGMFLVGLDIVRDKLLEINVFCPGGLGNAQRLEGVDFVPEIIRLLERKIHSSSYYRERWYHVDATML
ncbi:MAG: glutathione synthase [Cyanobacteria bacterium HKST-UBA02]|nr:glutathione synthase [Cyanobacteria bacterium HKST-UBA02]